MRICQIIGAVTLSRAHPAIRGAPLLLAVPYNLADLQTGRNATGSAIVIYDELAAGVGCRVGVSEGREAAMPFHPERKPLDAYCACILDQLHLGFTGITQPNSPS